MILLKIFHSVTPSTRLPSGKVGTHEGVQLWENGSLWAKTNVGASTESGFSAFVAGKR